MAFKNVNSRSEGEIVKTTELKVGESLTGYVTAVNSYTYEGQQLHSLSMVKEDGTKITLRPSGNLRYMIADGKVKEGLLTRITRTADKKVKGKNSTQFEVEQDSESTYNELDSAGITSDIPAAKGTSSVAARAAKLASQVK